MTTYRCASCGSPNVMTDTQAGGVSYDYKKGIIGTVVFGPGGAVAGISSKSQTVYKCADCGMCLTYTMPDDLRIAIDMGVNNADLRREIRLENGQRLSWNRIRQIYKNIESGHGDQQIERAESRHRNGLLAYATATQEEFDNAVDTLVDYEKRMSSSKGREHLSLAEYYVWQDALYTFIENAVKYLPKKLPERYRGFYLGRTNSGSPHSNAGKMLCYFFTYFIEKVALENGGPVTLQQLKEYAEYEPMILLFINWFFIYHFVPFGCGEEDIPYTEDTFHKLFIRTNMDANNMYLCYRRISPKINGQDTCTAYLPPYMVKNGIIGHWLYTGQDFRLRFNEELASDYFRNHPEKKTEYDSRISEYNASRKDYSAEIKSRESEINGYQSLSKDCDEKVNYRKGQIADNDSSVEAIRAQIESLRKKIFGKKAALAKADELEQEIQAILRSNDSLSQEIQGIACEKETLAKKIQECQKAIDALKEEEQEANRENAAFLDKLYADMDYFVSWRWDSGKRKDIISDVHNYLSDNEDATLNDIAVQFTDGDIYKAIRIIDELREKGLLDQ